LVKIQQYRIEINAAKKQVILNFSAKRLRTLCYFPMNTSTCSIEKGIIADVAAESTIMSTAELSWNTALLCSRGRLAKNLSDDSLYQLKSWPNLTRWQIPEYALNIAGLWSKSPNSISAISQQLSIPITHVRSFITAALDSHLAVTCDQTSDVVPFDKKKKNAALFKKLMNRLKRA